MKRMTLDEAIKRAEEVAIDKADLACTLWNSKEKVRCEECAEEHRQLAEWLKELKRHRKTWLSIEDAIESAIDDQNMRGEDTELLEWVSYIIDKAVKGIGEQDGQ